MKGEFIIEKGKVGQTLIISNLGYESFEFQAKKKNNVSLLQKEEELEEVLLEPRKRLTISEIRSYAKPRKIIDFYFNGHYSLARFFPFKEEYSQTPYIESIRLVVLNGSKEDAKFRIHLINLITRNNPSKRPPTPPDSHASANADASTHLITQIWFCYSPARPPQIIHEPLW